MCSRYSSSSSSSSSSRRRRRRFRRPCFSRRCRRRRRSSSSSHRKRNAAAEAAALIPSRAATWTRIISLKETYHRRLENLTSDLNMRRVVYLCFMYFVSDRF